MRVISIVKKRRSLFQKVVSLFTGFLLIFQSLTPNFFIPSNVFAEDSTPPEVTTIDAPSPNSTEILEPTQTPQPVVDEPLAEIEIPEAIPTVIPTETKTSIPEPTATPTTEPTSVPEPTATPTAMQDPTPTPSPWTFEHVQKDTRYEHNGVTLIFTNLPGPSGNIKIEEITLTEEQIKATGALSDKAYDITSDMTDGEFAYTLSLPIPESAKDKEVEIKFAEDETKFNEAETVENITKISEDSVVTGQLSHFTIFFVTDGTDTTLLTIPVSLNASDKTELKNSDDTRYEPIAYWPLSWDADFQKNQYIEFTFSPDIPDGASITGASILFEYQRDGFKSGSSRDAQIRAWNGTDFNTIIANYTDLQLSAPDVDELKTISIPLDLVNTSQKANAFKFRFYMRGRAPVVDGLFIKTRHDYVGLNVTYTLPAPTSSIFVQGDLDETKNITTNNRWFESFDNIDLKIDTGNQITDTIQYQILEGDVTCPDQDSSSYISAIHNTNLSSLINAKSDGIYSLCYFAKDQVGNQESTTHKEIVKKDNTNPSFTIDSVSGNLINGVYYNKAEIQTKITITDAESGYSHARYDLYNADIHHTCTTYVGANQDSVSSTVSPITKTLTNAGLSDGNYCLHVWAYDAVQNKAWTDTTGYNGWIKFSIDATVPIITAQSFITNDNSPKLTGTIDDPTVPVTVTINGKTYTATNKGDGTWELTSGSIIPTLTDGTYDVTASATDTAGNTGTDTTTNELTIDTKAPNALFKHYINGTEFTGGVAYVNNLNKLTFTGEYTDTSPSSQLLKDSYVIFDAQADHTFKFSQNGAKAYCGWRTEPNLVDLSGNQFSLTTQEAFTNCVASLSEGEYYMAHQVYDNAVRKDIPSITQFRDVIGLHFVIDTTPPAAPTAVFTSNGKQIPTNGYTNTKTFTFALSSTDATRYQLKYWNSIPGDPFNGESHAWNPKNLSSTYTDTFTRGEGVHYFAFSACDAAGNCSAYTTPFVITYDKTVPLAQITAPVASFLTGTVDIKGTVTDTNPHHYWLAIYRLSDNTERYSTVMNHSGQINNQLLYAWDTTKEVDGVYRIKFAERDAADNRSPDDIVDITIDNTAPTSTIISPFTSESGSTVYLNDWDGKITGTANDSTSGIQKVLLSIRRASDGTYYSSEDGWIDGTEETTRVTANGTTTWSFSLLDPAADDYTITSHAVDNANNIENSYVLTIILDKTIPEVTLSINPTIGDGENGWYKTQPEITLTGTDEHIDKIEYQWDSKTGEWTTYTVPFKPAGEGAHVLYYRAHDLANNYSEIGIKNIAWDKTALEKAPQNVSVSPNPSNGKNVKVTWEAATDNTGVDHYTITWKKDGVGERGTSVSETTREYIIPDTLTEGVWNVKVTAVDKAGFTADASANATVDLTAPVAPTLALTGTGVGSVSLAWNAVEGAVDYSVWYGTTAGVYDYAAHVGNVTSYTIQGLGAGTYYVVVAAYDNVVNRSAFSNEVNTGGAIEGAPGAATGPAEGFQPAGSVLGSETINPEATGQALGITTTAPSFSWWFILIGLLLIVIALYIYYRQRRRNR